MVILELFSGSGRISNFFKEKGWNVITVDINPKVKAMECINVYDYLDISYYQKKYNCIIDFIWCSPDCATYSISAGNFHRKKGGIPISDYAIACDNNNNKLFTWLKSLGIPFIVENPTGHFQKMEFVKGLFRYDLTYGSYGLNEHYKATSFISNIYGMKFYPKVSKKFFHSTVKYNSYLDRCHIPIKLIEDIYDNVINCSKNLMIFKQMSIFDFINEV